MKDSNLGDLLKVLEELRSEKYPEISKEIIEEIAVAQYNNQDNRAKARSETMRIISEYISKETEAEEE